MKLPPPRPPHVLVTHHGHSVTIRAAQPDDASLLADLVYSVSARTRQLRYFQPLPRSRAHAWAEGRRMAERPAERGLTLIAIGPGPGGAAVAAAELAWNSGATHAEGAIFVHDDYQRQGLGTALGQVLVASAEARGLTALSGHILPDNHAALRLIRRLSVPVRTVFTDGLIALMLHLPTAPGGGVIS